MLHYSLAGLAFIYGLGRQADTYVAKYDIHVKLLLVTILELNRNQNNFLAKYFPPLPRMKLCSKLAIIQYMHEVVNNFFCTGFQK